MKLASFYEATAWSWKCVLLKKTENVQTENVDTDDGPGRSKEHRRKEKCMSWECQTVELRGTEKMLSDLKVSQDSQEEISFWEWVDRHLTLDNPFWLKVLSCIVMVMVFIVNPDRQFD